MIKEISRKFDQGNVIKVCCVNLIDQEVRRKYDQRNIKEI